MEKSMKCCQSCGMPMNDEKVFGNNVDGSKNEDYCMYCFEYGEFKYDVTMEEMAAICIPHLKEVGMSEEEARTNMKNLLPKLKRWC